MGKTKIFRKTASLTLAVTTTLWLAGVAFLPVASAVTIDELLAQITALQAQIAALQGQQGATACTFTRSLFQGVSGADVKCLQQYLNSTQYKVAVSGVGSAGNETTFYGSLTTAAVAKWQAGNGVAPAVGYFGPISQAKYSALVGTPTPGASPTPGVSPAPAGGLSVSLSADNPAGKTLVADTTSGDGAQANAEILRLRFNAGTGGAVKVTQLRVTRTGISKDSDFSNAYLYDGSTRIAESPSVSGGLFTFTNSAGLFEVSSGSSKDISFRVDLANGAGSGLTATFRVASASDVSSNASSVTGTYPIVGNEFRTATVSDLGKLTLDAVSPAAANNVDAGLVGHELWRWTAQASDQKIQVSYLKVSFVGTANYDAFENVKLYVDGVQVGSTLATLDTAKSGVFDLASAPIEFNSGVTKTFSIRGDIVRGSGRTYRFQLSSSSDIVAKDVGYGIFVKVNPDLSTVPDVWTVFRAGGETTISEGSLTVTKSNQSPTGPLALNATNLEVARYDVKAVGEDIKISQITVFINDDDTIGSGFTNLKNVKAQVDGVQIGTTASTVATDGSGQAFSAGNSFVVKAGSTSKLSVYSDVASASGAADALVASDAFTIELDIAAANTTRMSSGTTFSTAPADNLAANAITVSSGNLSATKNNSLANVSTVVGASGVTIASWLITAPSEQGVSVNSVTIEDNGQSGSNGLGSAFDVLKLMSGGTQYGQTVNSPSSTAGTDLVFSFSTSLQVPAGQSKQVDLVANVLSSASTSVWNGGSVDAARIIDMSATGLVTNSTITYGSGNVAGQLLTINSGATLTMANESSPTMPNSTYLVAGDGGQTLAAWKFTANNTEDVKVTRVKVFEVGSTDKPGNFTNLKIYVDGVQVGSAVPAFTVSTATSSVDAATLDEVLFEDQNGLFTVPKNASKTMVLKADITDNTNAQFSVAGTIQNVRLEVTDGAATATTNVSGKGSTSGALVTLESGSSATNALSSNNMKVVKSRPTFALVSPSSTTLIPAADQEVYRFRITAHSAEDVKLVSGTSNIRFTMSGSPTTATAYDFKLYDAGTGTQIGSTVSTATVSAGTINFTEFGTSDTVVSKGTTKEFYVLASLNNFSSIGNTFRLSIKNAAADFSWSDTTASADITTADFVGYGLPLDGPTFVKP